jgi:hypothetical protein
MISGIHWHWWEYPSPLHLRCCRRCGECNASRMLWLFRGWVAVCMKLLCWTDTELWYVAGQDWDCVDVQGHYQGQGGPWRLGVCTSDTIFTQASIGIAFLLSTAPMSGNHFVFSRSKSWWHRQKVFAHDELASVKHLIILHFSWQQKLLIPLHCDDIYMHCLFQWPTYLYHHFFLLTDYVPFNFILLR